MSSGSFSLICRRKSLFCGQVSKHSRLACSRRPRRGLKLLAKLEDSKIRLCFDRADDVAFISAILPDSCEIFLQWYVAAPDHPPATAICVWDLECLIRLGAGRFRSPSACWPELQVSLILTTMRSAPAILPGLFLCRLSARLPQFARPLLISNCQSLITPGGNSRSPAPARRQASGHMSSKA